MNPNDRFPLGPYPDNDELTNDKYIEGLYQLFLSNFIYDPLPWKSDGQHVSLRRHPEVEGRHAVFWHIISGGSGAETARKVDMQRCIRLRWVRILVEIFNNEFPEEIDIRWWVDKKRSSNSRYVLTRPEFDYIVVIEQRSTYALLVTAYYAEHKHRRRKLKRVHDEFWQKQEPPTK